MERKLKIISASERMAQDKGVKALVVGPAGVGKTSLLRTLDPTNTLFIDLEAGDLAVQDVQADTMRPRTWEECRDLACYLGGPNPALPATAVYSQAHYDAVLESMGGADALAKYETYFVDSITPPTRVGNYTQIMRKDWIISNTQEVVDNAGKVEKRKYQKLKKGIELRKDVEYAIVSNTASVAGATRSFGSLPSWLVTNVSRGATGANGGFSSGTGLTVAATPGTQRAFTKTLLDTVMQSCYVSGGNVRHLVVSPYVKSVFVTFMSDTNVASFRYAANDGKNSIIANADVYEGPFGKVMVHPNRVMATDATAARNAFLLDTEMLSFDWLRKIQEDKGLAKTGDADKGVILGEGTLRVKNEKGLGVIADVYGLTSSS